MTLLKKKNRPREYPRGGDLVEAAGQLFHAFRHGLDYSFTCGTAAGESVLWAVAHPSTPWVSR